MTRLIDADALRECFEAEYETVEGIQVSIDRYALKCIDDAPTIDAEPMKYGKNISENGFLCSVCSFGDFGGFHGYEPNYCPNCGCAMTKEKEK